MVNIVHAIWNWAEREPDRIAVRSPRKVTFGQLRETGSRVATALRSFGVRPYDRVLLIAPTIPEFPETYYGLHAAGVTVITMNTMSTPSEIGYVLDDAQVSIVIAWHECSSSGAIAAGERGIPVWVIDSHFKLPESDGAQVHDHDADATALILYTSGTTGAPKGAELTAGNIAGISESLTRALDVRTGDRFGTALPLFHVFGQCCCMNTHLANGASVSLLARFDPVPMLELMRDDALTTISGVPTTWIAMLRAEADYGPEDFKSLRLANSGGASLPHEAIRGFEGRFGCQVIEGYGLTETLGGGTINPVAGMQKQGTVGPAIPGMRIEIRDPDGETVPAGGRGEVHLKGPTVMKGYWGRPDATAEAFDDGWFKTGDVGVLDDDGYLTIVDRVKDVIIRGGYNIYPREVEEVLYQHPDIADVAVVGVPDPDFGEEVAAAVVLNPDATPNAESTRAWAKERLSAYKVPRLFSFVEALPKGATGKILKRAIDTSEFTAARRSEAH